MSASGISNQRLLANPSFACSPQELHSWKGWGLPLPNPLLHTHSGKAPLGTCSGASIPGPGLGEGTEGSPKYHSPT